MATQKIVKKISIGGINGVNAGFKGVKERQFVARVYGLAISSDTKESKFGTNYEKFIGEFQAVNKDGEVFVSPVCFMPEPAQSLLGAQLKKSEGSVKFGFDFYVNPRPDIPIGYEYQVEPLIEKSENNLLDSMANEFPALPAPNQGELPVTEGPASKDKKVAKKH